MDRNEANLIQKKIEDTRTALKLPGLKKCMRRLLTRRIEGLKREFELEVKKQLGVI
jgi:hypothetical protein